MHQKIRQLLIGILGVTLLLSGYVWHTETQEQKLQIKNNSPVELFTPPNTIDEKQVTDSTDDTPKNSTDKKNKNDTSLQPASTTPHSTLTSAQRDQDEPIEDTVTLTIDTTSLLIPYYDGMTAENAMQRAMEKYPDKFSYKGTSYGGGLGTFVEEINGKKENYRDKMHWILYLNGKKSSKGISSVLLNNTDIITWNYEKEIL